MDLVARITNLNARLADIRDVFIQRSKLQNQALKEGVNLHEKLRLQHATYDQKISQLAPLFAPTIAAQARSFSGLPSQSESENYERSFQLESRCFDPPDHQCLQEGNATHLQFNSEHSNSGLNVSQSRTGDIRIPNFSLERGKKAKQPTAVECNEFPTDGRLFQLAQVSLEHHQELDNVPEVLNQTYEPRNISAGGDNPECDTLMCDSGPLGSDTPGRLLDISPGVEVTLNLTLRLEPEGKVTGKYSCSRMFLSNSGASGNE
ncbi:hypothetical protein BIW11_05514 [Tropilaelaps mercedesae]|uniref:Uncharacterized protein n=1 Tax=Tropilaelaps mercedesae TaxID=418985 RepID=A0A1V9Y1Z2_9ACAR|nr:hypothetical protein BIW11_05514 [Tropilaelaps mercedesae]